MSEIKAMNYTKAEVHVDLNGAGATGLTAASALSHLQSGSSFHEKLDRRHPLGIYNVSVNRICRKLQKCCEIGEVLWKAGKDINALHGASELREQFVDYLELCIYAAAEHVDDVEAIAGCFFPDSQSYAKSQAARELKKILKPLRDRTSAIANAIKHNQSRLRLFSLDFRHNDELMCLHGFFIEGYRQGSVCPNPEIHQTGGTIVSVTSFLWSILVFLILTSRRLTEFLQSLSAIATGDTPSISVKPFGDAVIALARLPLYSFEEVHPFEETRVVISGEPDTRRCLDSGLYGSIVSRWTRSSEGGMGNYKLEYEGDGASRSFQMVFPAKLKLQHWD